MPPAVGRYHPQNVSNPFAHPLNQIPSHQASQLQHPNANLQQNLGHPAFPPGSAGIFNPSAGNAGLQGGFGGGGALGGGGTGLASHAAQMGFHNATLQHSAHESAGGTLGGGAKGSDGRVRQVWKHNLEHEMAILRELVAHYSVIAMDTEFPGVVARPIGDFTSKASYHYQTVRCNVDLLKVIQLGICLYTKDGEPCPPQAIDSSNLQQPRPNNGLSTMPCTWSFNFKFSVDEDMYNEDSINVLKKAGVDFAQHASDGIDPKDFASVLITSGLVMDEDVAWISFHGGYDFAYLMKCMWNQLLPIDESEYGLIVKKFFPNLLDVKYLLRYAQGQAKRPGNALPQEALRVLTSLGQKSGLQDLADELGVQRVGMPHTAGSDCALTGAVFWALKAKFFEGVLPDDMTGQMWGLTGVGAPASLAMQNAVIAAQGGAGVQGHGGGAIGGGGGGGGGINGAAGAWNPSSVARDNAPSTPTNIAAGLAPGGGGAYSAGSAGTPGPAGQGQAQQSQQSQQQHGLGAMTPGGFGNFQYQGNR